MTADILPMPRKERKPNPPYDLQTLYSQVYAVERGGEYGRQTRDLKDAKDWLELYPDFWESESAVEKFQTVALNYIRSQDPFWKLQNFPMFGMLMQYGKFQPATKIPRPSPIIQYETCEHCLRDYEKGTVHTCK
jgi:hypothetical protein